MVKIAVLGWGSLIWNPGDMPLASDWKGDGPTLPIEFARESSDGRITLVLVEGVKESPALWAQLAAKTIEAAKAALATREGISGNNIKYSVGFWEASSGTLHGACSQEISKWAIDKGLDGVVWTNLKYGFKSARDKVPALADVIKHFENLPPESRRVAEKYVRNTPAQVRTEFRGAFENELDWHPTDSNA